MVKRVAILVLALAAIVICNNAGDTEILLSEGKYLDDTADNMYDASLRFENIGWDVGSIPCAELNEYTDNTKLFPSYIMLADENEAHKGTADTISSKGECEGSVTQSLIVPSINDVREHGYPRNENGETYGPDIKELDIGPDLVLVRCGDGYGYIRRSEMDDDGVGSPEDAVDKMRKEEARKINVYLQDGTTCIGTFDLK